MSFQRINRPTLRQRDGVGKCLYEFGLILIEGDAAGCGVDAHCPSTLNRVGRLVNTAERASFKYIGRAVRVAVRRELRTTNARTSCCRALDVVDVRQLVLIVATDRNKDVRWTQIVAEEPPKVLSPNFLRSLRMPVMRPRQHAGC